MRGTKSKTASRKATMRCAIPSPKPRRNFDREASIKRMQPGIPGFFLVPKLRLCLSRTPFMQFCHAPADQSIIETDPAFFANRTQDTDGISRLGPMKQTPIHDRFNPEVLAIMPKNLSRVVEVGCSSALAKAYLEQTPACEYIGIELDPGYAEVARASCTRVLVGDIEEMDERTFSSLFPANCWVFADVLEHLYDPWAVLRRLRGSLSPGASVVACIPNAQHWSFQARLNCGILRYEDEGLFDRTHIRWFTMTTIGELF